MGSDKRLFFIGGIAASLFYLLLVFVLIYFFNEYKRSKRYVPAKSESIEVSILQQSSKKPKPEPKPAVKREQKQQVKLPAEKKVSATAPKSAAPKPKAISSLFEGIKASAPVESGSAARLANAPKIKYKAASSQEQKVTRKASQLIKDINLSKPEIEITSKSSGIGEVNEYMSRLYDKIYRSWQPEAVYAGEQAKVRLRIAPDGSFEYSLLYPSDNQGFNQSLIEYLDRLKREKLPPRKESGILDVDVEFKAKE